MKRAHQENVKTNRDHGQGILGFHEAASEVLDGNEHQEKKV